MQANDAMQKLLRAKAGRTKSSMMPANLLSICRSGFVREGNCVFLKHLYDHKGNGTRDKFFDDVGYECFVNHIHVDEYSEYENFDTCLSLIDELRVSWLDFSGSGMEKIRVIISSDADGECVLRFHKVRTSESWLAQDLNLYMNPVLVQDIP